MFVSISSFCVNSIKPISNNCRIEQEYRRIASISASQNIHKIVLAPFAALVHIQNLLFIQLANKDMKAFAKDLKTIYTASDEKVHTYTG